MAVGDSGEVTQGGGGEEERNTREVRRVGGD